MKISTPLNLMKMLTPLNNGVVREGEGVGGRWPSSGASLRECHDTGSSLMAKFIDVAKGRGVGVT